MASAAVIATVSVVGVVAVGIVVYVCRKRRKEGGLSDATSPLLGKTNEVGKKESVAMQLLQKQIHTLRNAQEKVEPQHNRLVQQDLVNRKIFEQLNNQQKNINEVISSQDRILRDQLQKIDLIERQEECLIEKVDEFIKEIVAETAKEIHNETEYHHYRHRKLQQTLLQQAAQRTAGIVDVKAVEEQLSTLKTMFQRQQEDRQSLVATLTAVNNSGSRFGGSPSPPPVSHASHSPSPESSNASPVNIASVIQTSLNPSTHPREYHKKKHPSEPFKVKGKQSSSKQLSATFPYPTVDFNDVDANVPGHLSPPATDVAAALLPKSSSTGAPNYPPSVPPAIKARQRRQQDASKREQSAITITKQDSGATEDWWKGLVSTSASALRPSATFRNDQTVAEEAVARAERAIPGGAGRRKSTFEEHPPPPLPPLSVSTTDDTAIPMSPESDSDDDLAYDQLPTQVTMQEV